MALTGAGALTASLISATGAALAAAIYLWAEARNQRVSGLAAMWSSLVLTLAAPALAFFAGWSALLYCVTAVGVVSVVTMGAEKARNGIRHVFGLRFPGGNPLPAILSRILALNGARRRLLAKQPKRAQSRAKRQSKRPKAKPPSRSNPSSKSHSRQIGLRRSESRQAATT